MHYHEAHDFNARVQESGYKTVFNPVLIAKHLAHDSRMQRRIEDIRAARLYYYQKHWGMNEEVFAHLSDEQPLISHERAALIICYNSSMSKLIILRGNSGSGKSTVAKQIASAANHKIAIIDADLYRVQMLFPKPINKDEFAELMQHNVLYCLDKGYDVLWDSIFHANERNQEYLGNILKVLHPHDNYIFNFKTSFEETIRRHKTRHKSNDFGADEMKEWYQPNEELGYRFEHAIQESSSLEETVSFIKRTVWPG